MNNPAKLRQEVLQLLVDHLEGKILQTPTGDADIKNARLDVLAGIPVFIAALRYCDGTTTDIILQEMAHATKQETENELQEVIAKHERGERLTYAEQVIWYKELSRLMTLGDGSQL
jgi:hypothetical protein